MDSPGQTQQTCDSYECEADACIAFDQVVEQSGLFSIYRETTGVFIQPPTYKKCKGKLRLDRILIPKTKLTDAGWQGAIGVEIKKSGEKIGPFISQMLDYTRCVWTPSFGVKIVLDYIFLFPAEKSHNELASIMAQNRIGTCCFRYPPHNEHYRLQFFCGEQSRITYYINQDRIEVANLSFGKRAGSR